MQSNNQNDMQKVNAQAFDREKRLQDEQHNQQYPNGDLDNEKQDG